MPGLVKKINISLFTTAESKKSSGPNEALCGLQGVRLAYAEEPSAGMVLDGGWLKDLCGGVEMNTSAKYGHQIYFEITFHAVLISNNDQPLDISPNEDAVLRHLGHQGRAGTARVVGRALVRLLGRLSQQVCEREGSQGITRVSF